MSTELLLSTLSDIHSIAVKPLLNTQSQECPHCRASMIAQEIPADRRHNYLPMVKDPVSGRYVDGPDDGRFMFYSHVIGRSSILHDRTLAYTCPFCDVTDVIPGLEAMWAELMVWETVEYAKDVLRGAIERNPYAELDSCIGPDGPIGLIGDAEGSQMDEHLEIMLGKGITPEMLYGPETTIGSGADSSEQYLSSVPVEFGGGIRARA
jgi:hypothetical protein